jgi:CRP-like cAMP-binding protein
MADFQALTALMKPDKNSHNYREAIAAVPYQEPCMPYLGLFLSDLTFTEETGKFINGTTINTNYTTLVGSKLRTFKSYQRRKYKFMKPLYSIYGELVFGEDELYKLSKLREETSTALEGTKLSMLRSESRKVARDRKSNGPTLGDDEDISVDKFSKRDWQILLANAETITLQKGEVLLKENEESDMLYVVNSGMICQLMKDGHALDVTPGELATKSFRGIQSSEGPLILSIVAVEESIVSGINKSFLFRIFETELDLAARFYKYVANQENNMLRSLMSNYANRSPAVNKRRSVRLEAGSVDLNDADKVFSSTFKSIGNEVVVKSYFCKGGVFSGQLFITKNYICFSAKAFGLHKKKVTQLNNVSDINTSRGCLEVLRDHKVKPKKFVFHTEKELEDCGAIATSLWSSARSRSHANPLHRARSNSGGSIVEDTVTLTPEDWKLILKGTKCITYESGTKLISEGVRPTALYQIARGTCSVQMQTGDTVATIATRKEGDIFGELSFLDESQVASASVICDGQVDVYILDYNFVHIILSVYKYLAPKFYRYISELLWLRITQFLYRTQ